MWALRGSYGCRRHLDDGEKQSELANGVGEAFVVHRLGDVDIAAELVATLDFLGIVGRGEHHHRRTSQIFVFLEPPQDLDAAHVGQVEVEQDQQRPALVIETGAVAAEQIVHRFCTVDERHDLVIDAGAPDVALDQAGVPLVVLDHDDGDWLVYKSLFRLLDVPGIGSVIVNVLPLLSSDCTDMVPPSRRTRARTWARPMPWPGLSCGPARRKRSKIR